MRYGLRRKESRKHGEYLGTLGMRDKLATECVFACMEEMFRDIVK